MINDYFIDNMLTLNSNSLILYISCLNSGIFNFHF